MTIDDIATDIRQTHNTAKLTLIGIEGYGGSGKTTCARYLANALGNAYVVSLDDFVVKERLTDTAWDKGVFDRERLERQVLLPASNGQPVMYQRLEWVTNTLTAPLVVPDVDYLIVEGITAYHPTIERYYTYKIWIDIPIEIAQARGHARDGSAENADYWDQWAKNDIAYQQQYHSEQRADYCFVNW
ncbi:MAG TPA: AAA family ATPase [Ktedonobacterales bacterium]